MNSENLKLTTYGNYDLTKNKMPNGFVFLSDFISPKTKVLIKSTVKALTGFNQNNKYYSPIIHTIIHTKEILGIQAQLQYKHNVIDDEGVFNPSSFSTEKKAVRNIIYIPRDQSEQLIQKFGEDFVIEVCVKTTTTSTP